MPQEIRDGSLDIGAHLFYKDQAGGAATDVRDIGAR